MYREEGSQESGVERGTVGEENEVVYAGEGKKGRKRQRQGRSVVIFRGRKVPEDEVEGMLEQSVEKVEEGEEWVQEKSDAVKHSAGSVIRLRKSGGPALLRYQVTALPSCPEYIHIRVTVWDQ